MTIKAKITGTDVSKTYVAKYYIHRSPTEQKERFCKDVEFVRNKYFPGAVIGEIVIE